LEDIAVVYLGSAVFKIARLMFIALFSVHLFACIFYRVKMEGANSPEEILEFYTSRNVVENVRAKNMIMHVFKDLKHIWSNHCELYTPGRLSNA
jgi:hypothetical protein